ncbi:MAG: hypothetical protein ACRYFS_22750 [Janthinobacterium lividum]
MTPFLDNDEGYFDWLKAHPEGFVANSYRKPTATYLFLHRATCLHIQRWPSRRSTLDYQKVCAASEQALQNWAATVGGALTRCRTCQP